MTRQRYTFRESVNRILRILEGKALPNDYPETITGDVLSTDEAVSDLAELMAGSLPNESFTLPSGADVTAYTASAQEARLGSSTTKFVTPFALDETCLWGQIYTYTGTTTLTGLTQDVFTRITGSFQNYQLQSNGYINTQPTLDRIMINAVGTYLIDWNLSFLGSPDVTYVVAPHMNSGTVYQSVATIKPLASGSVVSLAASGILNVTATNTQIDLRVAPGQTGWLRFIAGQMNVRRIAHNE